MTRSMYYELSSSETRNILGEYDSFECALDAVASMLNSSETAANKLMLSLMGPDGSGELIVSGPQLSAVASIRAHAPVLA